MLNNMLSSTPFPSPSHVSASLLVFSGHLLNKLLALEFSLQGLHLGEPKLKTHII